MKFFRTHSRDVFYNLAFEEYVFETYTEGDCLLLWINDKSVVLGKFQNAYEEINLKAVETSGLKVARRNTGGGTVYHDQGNLNYSLIMDWNPDSAEHQYDVFLTPMLRALNQLGVPAKKRRKSDIAIGEKKISGSAQSIKKERILHHGTLLFDADLQRLHEFLKPTEAHITSKAVQSVRSQVVNIKEYLKDPTMTIDDLESYLAGNLFPFPIEEQHLSEAALAEVQRRKEEKFDTWKWNYGNSPNFAFHKKSILEGKPVSIQLEIQKGHIERCQVSLGGAEVSAALEQTLQNRLTGQKYTYVGIRQIISQVMPEEQAEAWTDYFF